MEAKAFAYDPVIGPVITVELRTPSESVGAKLLISTATKRTYVDASILVKLKLPVSNHTQTYRADLHFPDFDVTLPNRIFGVFEGKHPITSVVLHSSIDGILGADILKSMRLTVSGVQRQFTLSLDK